MSMLRRLLKGVLCALGLLLLVVTIAPPLLNSWANLLSDTYHEPRGDVLIILGADQLDTGAIGVASYWRSIYAALVWRTGNFREVLICGGPPAAPLSAPMKDFLVSQGVPAAAIRLETESRSTRENAVNAARLLANTPGKKVLLSSDYHMYRAVRCFRKVGLQVTPTYFPEAVKRNANWRDRWRVFLDLTEETIKIIWYKLHGWI